MDELPPHSVTWFTELVDGSINEDLDSYLRDQADSLQSTGESGRQGPKRSSKVDARRSYTLNSLADPTNSTSGSSSVTTELAQLEPQKLKQRISLAFLCLQRAIEFTRRSPGAAVDDAGWLEVANTLAKTTLAVSQQLAIMQAICKSKMIPAEGITLMLKPLKISKQQKKYTDPTDVFFSDLTALADQTCLAECCWRPWQACAENLLDTLASSQSLELKDIWQRRFILQAADVLLSAGKWEHLFSLACRCILFKRLGWSNTFASIAKFAQEKVNLRVMTLAKNTLNAVSFSNITPIAYYQLKNWWSSTGQEGTEPVNSAMNGSGKVSMVPLRGSTATPQVTSEMKEDRSTVLWHSAASAVEKVVGRM
ncbi:unnamed protein product [Schistocephalus solidus]|uniref:Uncharacterized protein n=1 Tax=Schistocephalus solidus TaxID=70667 RepID=A0A183T0P2_SCHSO|nr:unnamed protein product [Schistocephalus solidus]